MLIFKGKAGDWMNPKQKIAVDEFIICGDKKSSMLKAGYSKNYADRNAESIFGRQDVKEYIAERMKEIDSKKIADQKEVMEFLTAIMRGEKTEQVLRLDGDGYQVVTDIEITAKDKLRAAELIGKRHQMFTDKVDLSTSEGIKIIDDIG